MKKRTPTPPAPAAPPLPLKSTSTQGWCEAAMAWEVCASLHKAYTKGRDPFYTTRQADLVKRAAEMRERARKAAA